MSGVKRALIIEENRNPSSDFFVVPDLVSQGYTVEHVSNSVNPGSLDARGALLVFVRYLPAHWKRALDTNAIAHAGIVYFADDDLFDAAALRGLPLRYRWKIRKLAGKRLKRWLADHHAVQCWVSTASLAERYPELQCRIVAPRPVSVDSDQPVTVFYHASASHIAEMRWLLPVMREVLSQAPHVRFEVIGNPEVYSAFRRLPRTSVLMPMSWPAYQSLLRCGGRQIGLAPLLDNAFNQARSPTKFFDITAAGGCGLYAEHPVYQDFITSGEDGLVLPMEPRLWTDAILRLAESDAERERLHGNAKRRYAALASA